MAKLEFISKFKDALTSVQTVKIISFFAFTVIITAIISSQISFFKILLKTVLANVILLLKKL